MRAAIAYDPTEWSDLFVAVAGASAALLGLLSVAVSINLERILGFAGLPERALETLLLLLLALVLAVVGLMPGQGAEAFGIEVLGIGLAMAAITLRLPVVGQDEQGNEPLQWRIDRWAVRFACIVPVLVAGISLLAESGGGIYWLAAGIVFGITGAVANAWVLMVEILR
jgi:hypothetical protein